MIKLGDRGAIIGILGILVVLISFIISLAIIQIVQYKKQYNCSWFDAIFRL